MSAKVSDRYKEALNAISVPNSNCQLALQSIANRETLAGMPRQDLFEGDQGWNTLTPEPVWEALEDNEIGIFCCGEFLCQK
jgi:hypothetical protein